MMILTGTSLEKQGRSELNKHKREEVFCVQGVFLGAVHILHSGVAELSAEIFEDFLLVSLDGLDYA